jgi:hypothetical protein
MTTWLLTIGLVLGSVQAHDNVQVPADGVPPLALEGALYDFGPMLAQWQAENSETYASLAQAAFDEAAALGAALLAGVGAGIDRDTIDAPGQLARSFATVSVDEPLRGHYLSAYQGVYRRIYPQLKDLHHAIRELTSSSTSSAERASAIPDAQEGTP